MEKLKYYIEKYKLIIIVVILLISALLLILFKTNKKEITKNDNLKEENIMKKEEEVKVPKEVIKVDIKGSVLSPGVYEFDTGSRVIDAINKAGGLLENSNTEYLNLSKKLTDEMIVIIYTNEEVNKFKKEDKEIVYIEYECNCIDNINSACINDSDIVNSNGVKSDTTDGLVSINNATKEELMTLSGIGEAKAIAIIKYREENGSFKDLEGIKNVSGIGDSAYSKIKDNIKL